VINASCIQTEKSYNVLNSPLGNEARLLISVVSWALVYCVINPFSMIVIPAEAGIQENRDWMPHQVRHDMPTESKEVLDALHWFVCPFFAG
jgi:hypothetical protein